MKYSSDLILVMTLAGIRGSADEKTSAFSGPVVEALLQLTCLGLLEVT